MQWLWVITGILNQAVNASTTTDIADTKEQIELALIGYYDETGKYTEDDVESAVQDVLGSDATIDETDEVYTVTTEKGNTVDISDLFESALEGEVKIIYFSFYDRMDTVNLEQRFMLILNKLLENG